MRGLDRPRRRGSLQSGILCKAARGIARRRHLGPGLAGPDKSAAARDVVVREQRRRRHVDEAGVADPAFAVRKGQLKRLYHHVQRVRAVVAHRRQRLQVEQAERLEQRRPLAPGAAGIDVDALDRDPLGRLHRHSEGGEVVGREQAAVLAMVLDDGRCDVAPIEGGTGGGEARGTVAAGGALLIRHVLEGAPEIGLHEDIADGRRGCHRAGRSPRWTASGRSSPPSWR